MSSIVDTVIMRVFDAMDAGIGRKVGQHGDLPQTIATPLQWAESRMAAEKGQSSIVFESWLETLRPDPSTNSALSAEDLNHQQVVLSDVASIVSQAIEVELGQVQIENFDMEPQGFGPPHVISNFRWVAITLAQQALLQEDFGWPPGQDEDFMRIYEAGHLPVGCIEKPHSTTLLIW